MKKSIYLFLLITFFSCSKEEKPSNLLPEDKMTDLLYDLTLHSSLQLTVIHKNDSLLVTEPIKELLKKYQLDSITFKEQHRYYINQPIIYATMFDSVQKRLDRDIKKAEELPDDPRDSIATKNQLIMKNFK